MQTMTDRPTGMLGFTLVWLGQIVSVLATSMTAFAFTIWVFQKTGSVTALGLMQVFFITPFLLISPIAGVMVDRYDRKTMMMISDLVAGLATVVILILQAMGILHVWHLYVAAIFQGLGNAFQWPAYSAAITTMVSKEQYGRANGMMSLIEMGPGVIAPLLAGALLPLIGLTGVLFIDVATFLFAISALLVVHIPNPPKTEEGLKAQGHVWAEAAYGFRYIFARPSLLGLQMVFFFGNLFAGIWFTLLAPMVLARTGNNSLMLGSVQTLGALGGVIGGIVMSLWGGFKRRVHGVLGGFLWSGITGILVGVGWGVPYWMAGMLLSFIVGPLIDGSNQAIWQAKVAPDSQGRVFSARRLIAWFANPISPIIAGTLADYVFEPAMQGQGTLPGMFSWLVGTGPGTGMGLLLIISSLFCGMAGLMGYFVSAICNAEDILPDHDQLKTVDVTA
ncbi:MAG: MFS transporter [Anaerolineales bacterium]|nr:MFS transporter [Anaerolineales bacterium]